MMTRSLFDYAPLATGLLYLAAAVVVHRKEAAFKINRRFSALCFAVAVWCLGYFLEEQARGHPDALLFWARVSHLGGAFAAPIGLHFILRFTRQYARVPHRLLIAGYSAAGLVALFLFASPWVIRGVRAYPHGHHAEWGPLYPLFVAGVVYCYALMIAYLLRALRRSASNIERNRIAYVFTGTLLMTVTTLLNFLPAFGVPVYAPGYLGALCFMLLVWVGIYRVRLMNIRQALARYLLLLAFWIAMGFCYVALLRFFEWAYPAVAPGGTRFLFHFVVIGFFVLVYQAVLQRLLPLAEQRLYPLKCDIRAMESALDARMAGAGDSAGAARALLEVTFDSIKVPAACVGLRDPLQPGSFILAGVKGDASPPARIAAPAFTGLRGAAVKEELRFDIELSPAPGKAPDPRQERLDALETLGMEALLPLRSGDAFFGFLAFAKKRFGGVYDRGDLAALALTAGRAAAHMAALESLAALKEREHLARMGEMTAAVAHEIKNPLGAIQGAADRLADNNDPTRFIALIRDETRRLDAIVRSFLGYARPADPSPEVVDLVRLSERCAELFRMESRAATFALEITTEARPLSTRIDPDFFKQIFFNIASNSLEARADGRLAVTLQSRDGFIRIDFVDDCGGMSAEARERAFQPFFTTKARGTGLGMAIVRKLVERMNGNIYIESVAGKGTLLRLTFPLHQPE
ncbi:MAG: ATP-binding protein [Fibrobacterota bacterium]